MRYPLGAIFTTMANLADRVAQNVPGKFYVDTSCVDCDQCRVIAPDFFGRNEDDAMSFISRQPVTPEEVALVEEAIGACATESIGSDGA